MAKRNTTGKPRKVRETERVYRSKAERDRYYQRIALMAAGIVVAIVGVVLLGALVNDLVVVPEQAIVTVNDQEIKTKEFQERYRAERWFLANEIREAFELSDGDQNLLQIYLSQLPAIPAPYTNNPLAFLQDETAFARYVLQNMELQAILEQEADEMGIEIDEGEIQAQVDDYFARWTNVSLTPTVVPSATVEQTATPTPLITATASNTPTPTATATETPLPTVEGCEGDDCATVTPLPSPTVAEATVTPAETFTPAPTSTPLDGDDVKATVDSFSEDYYNDADDMANVDREAVRDIFYLRALRVALRDAVTEDIPTIAVWANSRHILIAAGDLQTQSSIPFTPDLCEAEAWVTAKVEADAVYQALLAGEPFATLAQTVSADEGSGERGGSLGWAEVDQTYVEPFADAVINAQVGVVTEPVCSQFGWHIIQVLDRELREIPDFDLRNRRQTEYDTWEQDLLLNATIERREDWLERIPDGPTYEELLGDVFPAAGN